MVEVRYIKVILGGTYDKKDSGCSIINILTRMWRKGRGKKGSKK